MNTNKNETSANDVIEEKKNTIVEEIGEMSLGEGITTLWHFIKNVKLKYIAMFVFCFLPIVSGVIVYYKFFPLLEILWTIIKNSASMVMGLNEWKYSYCLLDRDLVYTIPLSIGVAAIVGLSFNKRSFLYAVVYFILLVSLLEVWDYWFMMKVGAKWFLGGFCFVVMFIIIPLLLVIRKRKLNNNIDTVHDDSD